MFLTELMVFGIYKKIANGNDVVEVYKIAQEMIKRIRLKGGPAFLELKTYRVNEHRVSESDFLRDEEEIKKLIKPRCYCSGTIFSLT